MRIGDLVEHAGIVAKVPIFRAPDLGSTGMVSAEAVIEAVRPYALIGLDTGDVSEVVVTRASRIIPAKDIEDARRAGAVGAIRARPGQGHRGEFRPRTARHPGGNRPPRASRASPISSIDPVPEPAGNAAQEVEAQRPAPAGPAYIEVARDGRLYRIPLRRQPGTADLERQNEQARQRERLAAARQQLAARLDQAAGVEDPSVRHPASVIDFTLQYEVPK